MKQSVTINSFDSIVNMSLKKINMRNFHFYSLTFSAMERDNSTVVSSFTLNTVNKRDLIALSDALKLLADKMTH